MSHFPRLKPELAYWLISAMRAFCLSMIFTASMIYQVTTVHLNPLQLVLVGTCLELTIFVFEIPTGVVADVYSRRLSIVIGYVLIGIGFLIEGLVPVFPGVLAGQMLWGLGYTFTSGATEAWVVDEIGEARAGQVFLRGSQVDGVAGLAGMGVSALLGSWLISAPIIAGSALLIVLTLVIGPFLAEPHFQPRAKAERNSWQAMQATLRDGIKLVRVHPALLTIFGIGLFYGLYSEGFDRLSTAHMLQDMAVPTLWNFAPVVWFAILDAIGSVLGLGFTEVLRRRLNTENLTHLTRTLFGLSALLAGALFGFGLAGNFWVAAGLLVAIGVVRGLIGPLYGTWVNQGLQSEVRATVISFSSQVDAIGQIAGGPGVGWIGTAISIPAALITSSLILSPVLALYGRVLHRPTGLAPAVADILPSEAP